MDKMEFAGFTPQQKYTLLKSMDYKGSAQSDEMDAFLASSPRAASMMGEYTKIAQQRVSGKPLSGIGMQEGGTVINPRNNITGGTNPDIEEELDNPPVTIDPVPEDLEAADITGGYDPTIVSDVIPKVEGEATTKPVSLTDIVDFNTTTDVSSGITTTPADSNTDQLFETTGTSLLNTEANLSEDPLSIDMSNPSDSNVTAYLQTINKDYPTPEDRYNWAQGRIASRDVKTPVEAQTLAYIIGTSPSYTSTTGTGMDWAKFSEDILNHVVNLPGFTEYDPLYDLNKDGEITLSDTTSSLKYAVDLQAPPEDWQVPPGYLKNSTSAVSNSGNNSTTSGTNTMAAQTSGYKGVGSSTTAAGGTPLNELQNSLATKRQELAAMSAEDMTGETGQALAAEIQTLEDRIAIAQQNIAEGAPSGAEVVTAGMADPMRLVTTPDVATITTDPNQFIAAGTGKVTDTTAADTTTVTDTSQAGVVTTPDAATYTADKVSDDVTAETAKLSAAQLENLTKTISAQDYTLEELNFLGFDAAQIDQYQKVKDITDIPDLTEEQKLKAAVLADVELPVAVAKTLTFDPIKYKADAAKFTGDTPKATAATDYDLGTISGVTAEVKAAELVTAAGGDAKAAQATAQQSLKKIQADFATGKVTADQLAAAQTQYDNIITSIVSGSVTGDMIVKAAGVGLSAEQSADIISKYNSSIDAVKGKVSDGETITAQDTYNLDPTKVAEITKTKVVDPATTTDFPQGSAATTEYDSTVSGARGEVGSNELVAAEGIGINKELVAQSVYGVAKTMEQVNESAIMKAATATFSQSALAEASVGVPEAMSTVQGQLSSLMNQFKDGTPAWAAGAMRAATALMNSRGLGGSSMAGAAITQAALESALPIAVQDATFYQEMQMTNLSNRQAVSLANAAAVQGIELQNLDNMQAAALKNSTQAFELQSQNLSNLQETVLANLNVKASIQNKSLDINTQAAVANAARFAELNNINLSNEQQALLQESSENLQIELSELSNEQQMAISMLQTKAALMGQNLSNEQQSAMIASTQAFEAANFNANAQQQAFMQDASAQAALEGRALDIRQQTSLFNAARIATVNDMNLTNEQQVLLAESAENLQIELQDLSNRQQTSLANAQLRAALQGKTLDNEQQAAILNAEQYAEMEKINLSNKQQAFIQDAVAKASLEGRALDNRQQAALFNAARAADVADMTLNNEQQALILQSNQEFDQDITNLSNRQQTSLANAQLRAALQGKVLDNQQQEAIINAERYAEVNNITVTNKQQAIIQEYVSRTTMEGKTLDNEQQARIFNVSNQIQERGIELSNQQQVNLFNSTNNLEVDMANLSNKQQTELANAQIEAALRGQELSNKQQANVINAARISEIANINFNAEQQREIENARLASSVDLANLDSKSAKMLAEMAQLASMDMAALNNRQQAEVQNAQNFLQMDLSNLDNEQQTAIFKSQQNIAALFNDQAAENARLQFNAASENQINQFFADLQVNVNKFNADQANAIKQFNAGETNTVSKFNAQLESVRDQFNASNALVIEQANTKWRQDIATMDTAAQNEANMMAAKMAADITSAVMDQIWQRERDLMSFAFTAMESMADRNLDILLADKDLESMRDQIDASDEASRTYLITKLLLG